MASTSRCSPVVTFVPTSATLLNIRNRNLACYLEMGGEIAARRGLRALEYAALDALASQRGDVRR
jgi:hypothetical protein